MLPAIKLGDDSANWNDDWRLTCVDGLWKVPAVHLVALLVISLPSIRRTVDKIDVAAFTHCVWSVRLKWVMKAVTCSCLVLFREEGYLEFMNISEYGRSELDSCSLAATSGEG